MISTFDSLCKMAGDGGADGFEWFDGPAGVFNATSMLLNADETWYRFSINIL